jgi:hypothetical protein
VLSRRGLLLLITAYGLVALLWAARPLFHAHAAGPVITSSGECSGPLGSGPHAGDYLCIVNAAYPWGQIRVEGPGGPGALHMSVRYDAWDYALPGVQTASNAHPAVRNSLGIYSTNSEDATGPGPVLAINVEAQSTVAYGWGLIGDIPVPIPSGGTVADGHAYLHVDASWTATSNTPTFTPVPTSSPTPIPTSTPGAGTPSVTPTPTIANTATPAAAEIDCGEPTFPLLNCNMAPFTSPVLAPTHWNISGTYGGGWSTTGSPPRPAGDTTGFYNSGSSLRFQMNNSYDDTVYAKQTVIVPAAGQVYIVGTLGAHWLRAVINGASPATGYINLPSGTTNLGHVPAGPVELWLEADTGCCIVSGSDLFTMSDIYVVPDSPWTPAPTSTATTVPGSATATPTPDDQSTAVALTTATAIAAAQETAAAAWCPPGSEGNNCWVAPAPTPSAHEAAYCNWWDLYCLAVPRNAIDDLAAVPAAIGTVIPLSATVAMSLTSFMSGNPTCTTLAMLPVLIPHPVGGTTFSATNHYSATWTLDTNSAEAFSPCAELPDPLPSTLRIIRQIMRVMLYVIFFWYMIGFVHRVADDRGGEG